MNALKRNWFAVVLSLVFGGVGWFAKDINLNGVSGATEPMALGGLTIGGFVGLGLLLFGKWQAAGGKLDGKLSEAEFKALASVLTDKLAPSLTPYVDKVAGPASTAVNKLLAPTATKLIDDIAAWFTDKTPDPNESVLNDKLLFVLAEAVKGDMEGSAAAAKLRERLHVVLFPPPSEVSVAQ